MDSGFEKAVGRTEESDHVDILPLGRRGDGADLTENSGHNGIAVLAPGGGMPKAKQNGWRQRNVRFHGDGVGATGVGGATTMGPDGKAEPPSGSMVTRNPGLKTKLGSREKWTRMRSADWVVVPRLMAEMDWLLTTQNW